MKQKIRGEVCRRVILKVMPKQTGRMPLGYHRQRNDVNGYMAIANVTRTSHVDLLGWMND